MSWYLCVVALCCSGLSFAVFLWALIAHLLGPKPPAAARPAGGIGNTEQQALTAESLAKLMEAFSKLTDSLNHAAPMVVALMASIIFFVLAMLAAAEGSLKSEAPPNPPKPASSMAPPCFLYPFDPGRHQAGTNGLDHLQQAPAGCAQSLVRDASSGGVSMLFLIGHADRRRLIGPALRYYGTNDELAYRRALEVKGALLAAYDSSVAPKLSRDDFASRLVVLQGGARYLDPHAGAEQLAQDRSVEIVPYQPPDAPANAATP